MPPRGEGRAGDRPIQELLEHSWPADLPKRQAADLVAVGRAVLIADVTGVGRDRFPTAFPTRDEPLIAPAFSRVRIQAAVARTGPFDVAKLMPVAYVVAGIFVCFTVLVL
ncbi:hypothetical protein ACWCRC_42365, partial [Streptomyces sp. NPDC001940]